MIEVKRNNSGLSIAGHANYAPSGQDIVCAGVSTLAQTLVVSISEMTTDDIRYDIQPGLVEIKYGNLSKDAQLLIGSFFVGIELIANNYPDYVRIV